MGGESVGKSEAAAPLREPVSGDGNHPHEPAQDRLALRAHRVRHCAPCSTQTLSAHAHKAL